MSLKENPFLALFKNLVSLPQFVQAHTEGGDICRELCYYNILSKNYYYMSSPSSYYICFTVYKDKSGIINDQKAIEKLIKTELCLAIHNGLDVDTPELSLPTELETWFLNNQNLNFQKAKTRTL